MEVRVRYNPSPTGEPHIGNIRTALFIYLFARHEKGTFVFRIEDTDRERSDEKYTLTILESIKWLGINPDEGVMEANNNKIEENGEFSPYIQSERVEKGLYQTEIKRLLDENKAYYCFCTKERLTKLREEQKKNKKAPGYDRFCRKLDLTEAQKRVTNGEEVVVRFAIPNDKKVAFDDIIIGHVEVDSNTLEDFILQKSDGFPTYNFAHIVDDEAMKITHIIRGVEYVPSIPKYILLYEALGYKVPILAHVPVILAFGGGKLSKRDGALSVLEYRQQGYLASAIDNYLALLGWHPEGNEEIFTLEELTEKFTLERVQKSPANFDLDKLQSINSKHIKHLSDEDFVKEIKPFMLKASVEDPNFIKLASLVKDKFVLLSQAPELLGYYFKEPKVKMNLTKETFVIGSSWSGISNTVNINLDSIKYLEKTFNDLKKITDWNKEEILTTLENILEEYKISKGDLFDRLRLIVANSNTPELATTFECLGSEKVLSRLEKALKNSKN